MSKWYELEDKKPKSGTICMVASQYVFAGTIETNYNRAVWFNENDEITTYDGSIQKISKSGFYVPLDPRPLGIYFGMVLPNLQSVLGWQENHSPYIMDEHARWEFQLNKGK